MSLQETIDEAIIGRIATRVLEKLQNETRAQYGAMVSEWATNRKAIIELSASITKLESTIAEQSNQIYALRQERQSIREVTAKALEIMQSARRELGLE